MGLSEDVDEAGSDDEPVEDLTVELNGILLSEVGRFESDAYGLPRNGPTQLGMVSAAFPLGFTENNIEVTMNADQAERVAYDLLAKVEEARELVEDE